MHLHLGLLAHWVAVSSIRFQLKQEGINSGWREIVRVMNTQKCVATTMRNKQDELLCIRACSKPTEKVQKIHQMMKMKEAPFVRKKSVASRNEIFKSPKN